MSGLSLLAWPVALVTAVPLAVLGLELVAGVLPARREDPEPGDDFAGSSIVILIPAHDEAQGIAATVASLVAMVPAGTRVMVVADNCTDDTAARAREAGAVVLERQDPERRGKGYALAFGRDALAREDTPDVVVVVDADCRLLPGSIEALASTALARGRPAQATNLIIPDLGAPLMVQFSSFAMLVKNHYRSRGMQRLGGAGLLTGTGMAFPWVLIKGAELATGSIVEDLALGIELTRGGNPPVLIRRAGVRSAPAALGDALQQRRRWEHGFLAVVRQQAAPTLLHGLARASRAEIFLGLHLLVPPLALTILLSLAAWLLVVMLAALGATALPAIVLGALLLASGALVIVTWLDRGRAYLRVGALLRAPVYLLWKLPIYLGFLRKREAEWTRTPRGEAEREPEPVNRD